MTYANYILYTGSTIVDWEEFLMNYFYETRFKNRSRILDLGAGRCTFTKQNVDKITAVDIQPKIVEYYAKQGINIHLGSAYEIPFEDGHFDGVFCCWLFEHLPEPERAMLEIKRVVKEDGYVLILVPSDKSLMHGFYDDFTHIRPFTKIALSHLAEFSGFTRYVASNLPYGKGGRILLRFLKRRLTFKYFQFNQRYTRKVGLVNQYSLMLEAWK